MYNLANLRVQAIWKITLKKNLELMEFGKLTLSPQNQTKPNIKEIVTFHFNPQK
jgi:hypothetical protein